MREKLVLSWSGGKDSCLALYRAVQSGGRPALLATMFGEEGERTRSHGLPRRVIEAQASAMGVALRTAQASWSQYEEEFVSLLRRAARHGIAHVVFGDIDVDPHRRWEERVSEAAGMKAHLPLWKQDRWALLQEWWDLGFKARIVVVREGVVGREFLGKLLEPEVARRLERLGADPCGENGEFHTVVTDGPLFARPIPLKLIRHVRRGDCWVQDLALGGVKQEDG